MLGGNQSAVPSKTQSEGSMIISRQRRLLMCLALPLLAACETPQSSDAPAPARVSGPSEPAPMPSGATDDYDRARRASRTAAPTGPDAMPGFAPLQRTGTDIMMAPIPQPMPR
ncbi:MAG: hypothetical protein JWR00_2639 [Rubritepida sp.]|nr:hypothetical protein [Rubritepida sp.]